VSEAAGGRTNEPPPEEAHANHATSERRAEGSAGHDVFVSYAREDQDSVRALMRRLADDGFLELDEDAIRALLPDPAASWTIERRSGAQERADRVGLGFQLLYASRS
jgi:hypothetical protein